MKILVLHTHFEQALSPEKWEHYFHSMPQQTQERILRYRRWQDQHCHLLGRLLLRASIKKWNLPHQLNEIEVDEFERPYFKGDFEFNISHSGNQIICVSSLEGRLGVDIEKIKPVQYSHFSNLFNPSEMAEIESANDSFQTFFKYWTIKESVIKANGKGMSLSLLSMRIKDQIARIEGEDWHLTRLNLGGDDYACHLASASLISDLVIESIINAQ